MADEKKDAWTIFLEGLVSRPGWSVDRLAETSGINRSTIYRWLNGEIKTVTIESVRAIAKGGQASLAAALHAARAHTKHKPEDVLTDDDDMESAAIRASDLSEEAKRDLLVHLSNRRRQLAEEVDFLIKSKR